MTAVALLGASQVVAVVKNPPVSAGSIRDSGSIPGLGRSPGGRHGNPLQYSCLENPMERGAWWATVHRLTKSRTQLHIHSRKHHSFYGVSSTETAMRSQSLLYPQHLQRGLVPGRSFINVFGINMLQGMCCLLYNKMSFKK